jgi:hypothetical protein
MKYVLIYWVIVNAYYGYHVATNSVEFDSPQSCQVAIDALYAAKGNGTVTGRCVPK